MKQLQPILRAIQSFNDSSYKTIQLKNEKFTCSGMNSLYVSHQSVTVGQGHGKPGVIIVDDTMIIYKVGYEEEVEGKEIPSFWIRKSLEATGLFPFGLPPWLNFDFVRVRMPNRFRGYDDCGKPIWDIRNVHITHELEFEFVDMKTQEECMNNSGEQ